jgi:hypothetical protein
MHINQYRAELARLNATTRQNLIDLAAWAAGTGMPWLWSELAGMVPGQRISPLKPHDAIRKGLQTTVTDREKMPLKPTFYVAQMTMCSSEVDRYCAAVTRFASTRTPFAEDAVIHTLHGALKACMDHAVILLEQAAHALLDLPTAYGAWSRRVEHPFEIFKGAEQIVYGTYSGLTHADRAPFTPIAVLRTAIELRIRSAFGIQGYLDPENNRFVPIDLNRLFREIGEHLSRIDFIVDFHDVGRVYRWSNFYIHGGWRDFIWVPGYTLQFLRPLFADPTRTASGGWSIDGGIRMPREVWRAIRRSFETGRRGRSGGCLEKMLGRVAAVFRRRRRPQTLLLNPADEQRAQCVFLD